MDLQHFVLHLLLFGATQGSGTGVTRASSGVAICSCDLSPGNCDLNCCCDPDCNLNDPTSVFSFCLPGSTKAQFRVCLYNWLMFRSDTPYPTEQIPSSSPRSPELFCILPTQSSLNYFVTPQTVNQTTFLSLSSKYSGASFSSASENIPTFSSFYKAGDTILTISRFGDLGVLRQPAPVGGQSLCSDANPARFLYSYDTSCVRLISNLSESCTTDPSLGAHFYYQYIRILKVPTDATVLVLRNATVPIDSTVNNSPTYNTDTCENVVSKVLYTVLYNGAQGITNVSVSFTLVNLTSTSLSIQQTFRLLYKPVSSASLVPATTRSGNPGYLVGYPVLTENGPLTMLRTLGNGSCSRSAVQFGMNTLGGCTIRGHTSELCSNLSTRAYELLTGDSPQRLGVFGNASVALEGDWTTIIYKNCSQQGSGNCSTSCLLPVSLQMQILKADVGLFSNPQSQVLGARFVYSCRPVRCQDVTILQTQVSFTDLTRRGPAPRSAPTVTGRAPVGFFNAFLSNTASRASAASLLLLSLLPWTCLLST
ncbi:tectonic-3 [Bombina bombina]|uniref:tectonic-3 n=1 Tax=Bombina bombina TaxID=8345 RepID=UPI00235AFBCE|nr:tectonic-3 [Bombina bombina]